MRFLQMWELLFRRKTFNVGGFCLHYKKAETLQCWRGLPLIRKEPFNVEGFWLRYKSDSTIQWLCWIMKRRRKWVPKRVPKSSQNHRAEGEELCARMDRQITQRMRKWDQKGIKREPNLPKGWQKGALIDRTGAKRESQRRGIFVSAFWAPLGRFRIQF